MIVLDTNVISEMVKVSADPRVVEWLVQLPSSSVFTTTITQAEILTGLRILPDGKRRRDLEAAIEPIFTEDFAGRVLPFDGEAAEAYAEIVATRRQSGRPISQFDAQIGAIALSRGAAVATRNVDDFAGIGVSIVNPWAFSG
jgi:toxin FitB